MGPVIWAVEKSRAFATFLPNLNNLLLILPRRVTVRRLAAGRRVALAANFRRGADTAIRHGLRIVVTGDRDDRVTAGGQLEE